RAPTGIDFGGAWTDVPPYSDDHGGFVCNVALASHATVRVRRVNGGQQNAVVSARGGGDTALAEAAVRRLGVNGIALDLRSDFPIGAGLGGSSAAGVAVAGALAAWRGDSLD